MIFARFVIECADGWFAVILVRSMDFSTSVSSVLAELATYEPRGGQSSSTSLNCEGRYKRVHLSVQKLLTYAHNTWAIAEEGTL